jgi:hypothetical protein
MLHFLSLLHGRAASAFNFTSVEFLADCNAHAAANRLCARRHPDSIAPALLPLASPVAFAAEVEPSTLQKAANAPRRILRGE